MTGELRSIRTGNAALALLCLAACGPAAAPSGEPRTAAQAAVVVGAPLKLVPGGRVAQYGSAIALDGDSLAVAAPRTGDLSAARGAVHVYQRSAASGAWELSRTLQPADARDGDQFGSAVALSGDVLLVAARGRDEIVAYAAKRTEYDFEANYKMRPSLEHSRAALKGLVENARFRNTRKNPGYVRALGMQP